jgi:hypothetical protein
MASGVTCDEVLILFNAELTPSTDLKKLILSGFIAFRRLFVMFGPPFLQPAYNPGYK